MDGIFGSKYKTVGSICTPHGNIFVNPQKISFLLFVSFLDSCNILEYLAKKIKLIFSLQNTHIPFLYAFTIFLFYDCFSNFLLFSYFYIWLKAIYIKIENNKKWESNLKWENGKSIEKWYMGIFLLSQL